MNTKTFRLLLSNSILVWFLSLAANNAAYADGKNIVGAWLIESTYPEFEITETAVQIYNKDKTLSVTGEGGGTCYGIWRKAGNNNYEEKIVCIIEPGNPNGFPVGTIVTFLDTLTLDKKTDTVTGSGTVTWTLGEAVLFQTTATYVQKRITFDE